MPGDSDQDLLLPTDMAEDTEMSVFGMRSLWNRMGKHKIKKNHIKFLIISKGIGFKVFRRPRNQYPTSTVHCHHNITVLAADPHQGTE